MSFTCPTGFVGTYFALRAQWHLNYSSMPCWPVTFFLQAMGIGLYSSYDWQWSRLLWCESLYLYKKCIKIWQCIGVKRLLMCGIHALVHLTADPLWLLYLTSIHDLSLHVCYRRHVDIYRELFNDNLSPNVFLNDSGKMVTPSSDIMQPLYSSPRNILGKITKLRRFHFQGFFIILWCPVLRCWSRISMSIVLKR